MHPSPSHTPRSTANGQGGEGGGGGAAAWVDASPSLVPYPAAGVSNVSQHPPGMMNGALHQTAAAAAAAARDELAGGLALTPGYVRDAHGGVRQHAAPSSAGAMSGQQQQQQQQQQQWAAPPAEPLAPSSSSSSSQNPRAAAAQAGVPRVPAAAAAASALDLQRGMTSPWQGSGEGEAGMAVGVSPPPGMVGAGMGEVSETVGSRAAVVGSRPGESGAERSTEQQPVVVRQQQGLVGAVERGQDTHRQPRQRQGRQQPRSPAQVASGATAPTPAAEQVRIEDNRRK